MKHSKHNTLIQYAQTYGTKVFVETGTYKGDTVKAMVESKLFNRIHTVDIYQDRADAAIRRFRNYPTVKCWYGDSAKLLPVILKEVRQPALFWLDAHHSGKKIARIKGLIETPLLAELEAVLQHHHNHIILIDDANYLRKF